MGEYENIGILKCISDTYEDAVQAITPEKAFDIMLKQRAACEVLFDKLLHSLQNKLSIKNITLIWSGMKSDGILQLLNSIN